MTGATNQSLLDRVQNFIERSRAGEFFEDFIENAQVCMYVSNGTEDWIESFSALLGQSVEAAKEGNEDEARQALQLLFSLFSEAADSSRHIVFRPEDGRPWNPSVDWRPAVECYLSLLTSVPNDKASILLHQALEQLPPDAVRLLERLNQKGRAPIT